MKYDRRWLTSGMAALALTIGGAPAAATAPDVPATGKADQLPPLAPQGAWCWNFGGKLPALYWC